MDLDTEVANFAGQQKQPQEPLPSTSGVKTNSQVLFQPIFPAYVTPAQHRDQALFNSSLNLIDDSPRPQTSGSTARRPQPYAPNAKMLPTPYVYNTTTWNSSRHGNLTATTTFLSWYPTVPNKCSASTITFLSKFTC